MFVWPRVLYKNNKLFWVASVSNCTIVVVFSLGMHGRCSKSRCFVYDKQMHKLIYSYSIRGDERFFTGSLKGLKGWDWTGTGTTTEKSAGRVD